MDIRVAVNELLESGLTQVEIGRLCGCSQPTVSDLSSGKQKTINFDVGWRIVALHKERCGADEAAA